MTQRVHLRAARREELDAIVALDRASELAPHWPAAAYAAILHAEDGAPLRCLLVAEGAGPETQPLLIGFAVGLVHPASIGHCRLAELEDVVVAASFRRSGVGRALCSAVLEWSRAEGATEAVLEVRAANTAAIGLYAQLGFVEEGRRPRYYRDPDDDAVTMRLRWDSAGKDLPGGQTIPTGSAS